ncbi:MAG: peptidase S8 [Thalassobius sp.]|nr:peptidase S8 [Thalassovita sp.]
MKAQHILLILSTYICSVSLTFATGINATDEVFSYSDTTKKAPENWFNLDRDEDNVQGVSTEKTYKELLKGKESKTVIVAVIDGGVDVEHEDLQGKIWVNEGEIPGNGKDDDGNGYVDDINGWNFLGGKDGENVNYDTYELTREYVRLSDKFQGKTEENLSKEEKKEYAYFQEVKTEYDAKVTEAKEVYDNYMGMADVIKHSMRLISAYLNVTEEELTPDQLATVNSPDEKIKRAASVLGYALENDIKMEYLEEAIEYFENQLKYFLNKDFNPRNIVGDDYDDLTNRFYGNPDVTGPDATHGTHVSGIIAANRNNALGMKGVANDVKIMAIRAVPNGDEHDKDVANAIRYAVDNGADIINMSFGKGYSPNKKYVDEAVVYAESKGVLLVHAAGNDSENLDEGKNFPNKNLEIRKKPAKNWIEIGASSWGGADNFVGEFSNYGKKSVDVFAPGVDIYSTMPGSKYENQNGTSMASPVAAGVAALVLSYYPDLTAVQLKDILMKSSSKFDKMEVNMPGEPETEDGDDTVEFEKLSVTGGIVNSFEAVKLAESMNLKSKKR